MALMMIYSMSHEQAVEHRKLSAYDTIYVTQYARIPCDYQVIVHRGHDVPQQGEMGAEVAQLTIRRIDGHKGPFNWDDMMEIKDAIFGKEAEGFELFPSRKRAIHGNNQFRYIWVFTDGSKIPVGWDTGSN